MKNFSLRASQFFSYLFQSTTTLCFVIFVFGLCLKRKEIDCHPKVTLFGHKQNNCYLRFNPNTDLTSLFNINTKQVFLYAVCITGRRHEMVWSKIVQKKDVKKFADVVSANYPFRIVEGVEKHPVLKFEMRGSIVPHVGAAEDIKFAEFTYKQKPKQQ